jgi:hypothetical protein
MSAQNSYTKQERQVVAGLRDKLNHAESVEDVKKFFVQQAQSLLQQVFGEDFAMHYEDIRLQPDSPPYYQLQGELAASAELKREFSESDLDEILHRIAQQAAHRYTHLAGNPAKTEAKIRR